MQELRVVGVYLLYDTNVVNGPRKTSAVSNSIHSYIEAFVGHLVYEVLRATGEYRTFRDDR